MLVYDEVRFDLEADFHGYISLYYKGEVIHDRMYLNESFLNVLDANPLIAHEYYRVRELELVFNSAIDAAKH